ncbi:MULTISPECIES: hypothetical protein [Streptomyces]|nr:MULTISPECIES: hypothetical protein [Streptomyces]MDN5382799.1 hypothetical protein [Streptomyces sp. LB8]
MLGISPEVYARDPMTVIPALDDYASRVPLSEFEKSDRITLHLDPVSFLADFLIQKSDARWVLEDAPEGPVGTAASSRRPGPTDKLTESVLSTS